MTNPEEPGEFCFLPLAACIAGAARLMLMLPERSLTNLGGTYAMCDTDSLAIVATVHGDPIPSPGGPYRLTDRRAAIRSMLLDEVGQVRHRFRSLNPYGDGESIRVLEDENYALCGIPDHKPTCVCTKEQRQLFAYSVASKRYVLFNLTERGLGACEGPHDPGTGERIRKWEREV